MKATELAKAIHDLILKRGDVEIVALDPFSPFDGESSNWTSDIALISQPVGDGERIIGMLVPKPSDLRLGDELVPLTQVHTPRETLN